MNPRNVKSATLLVSLILLMLLSSMFVLGTGWSNKGVDDDENYGTHAWIGDHAIQALYAVVNNTADEDRFNWLVSQHEAFLLGTLAPDRPFKTVSGVNPLDYFDTWNHHNYYESENEMIEDYASERAQREFRKAIVALKENELEKAAFYAGAMAHYLGDLSNYMHVMGSDSLLGKEGEGENGSDDRHSEYEKYIRRYTDNLTDSYFNITYASVIKQNFETGAYEAGRIIGWQSHQFAPSMEDDYQYYMTGEHAATDFELKTGILLNASINQIANLLYTLGFADESTITQVGFYFNYRGTLTLITIGIGTIFLFGFVIGIHIKRKRS